MARAIRNLDFVLAGAGPALLACAEAVREAGHTIRHIVGRSPDCREWAARRGISTCDGTASELALPACDYLISIANDRILKPAEIASARRGAFNCHNSLLPQYRGAFAACWALLDDQPVHGASWHRITARIDQGPLAVQGALAIAADDTARTLNRKSLDLGIDLLRRVLLPAMASDIVPQITLGPSGYYPVKRRAPRLGLLPWDQGSDAALRHFRALERGPIDNSFDLPKILANQTLWLVTAARPSARRDLSPGTIAVLAATDIAVGTADGAIELGGLRKVRPLPGPVNRAADAVLRSGMMATMPDPATCARLEQLGMLSAAAEQRYVRRCLAAAATANPLRSGRAAVPAGDWTAVAECLLAARTARDASAIWLSAAALQSPDQEPEVRALFRHCHPLVMAADARAAEFGKRLEEIGCEPPALADVMDRRRALLNLQELIGSFVAIESTSDDIWNVVIA